METLDITPSRHAAETSLFAITTGELTVRKWHNGILEAIEAMPDYADELVAVKVWEFHHGELVVTRTIDLPRTKHRSYDGKQRSLPMTALGRWDLLDDLFEKGAEGEAWRYSEASLVALVETWATSNVKTGEIRTALARSFTRAMAARAGCVIPVGAV